MLRHRIAPLLLIASAAPAWAQFDTVDVAWEHILDNNTYEGSHPIEVEVTPDGGFLVVSLERELPLDDFTLPAVIVLRKLDENGDLEWSAALDSPPVAVPYYPGGRYADVAIDAQGDVFVVISRPGISVLRRYGANGTLAWHVDLPLRSVLGKPNWSLYNAAWVELAPSGDVIVGGLANQNSYPRGDVRAFGPDGTPRWEWRGEPAAFLGTTAHIYPLGMAVGPDGIVYLYGQSDQPSYQHGSHVIALSPDGSFLWWRPTFQGVAVVAADFDSQGQLPPVRPDPRRRFEPCGAEPCQRRQRDPPGRRPAFGRTHTLPCSPHPGQRAERRRRARDAMPRRRDRTLLRSGPGPNRGWRWERGSPASSGAVAAADGFRRRDDGRNVEVPGLVPRREPGLHEQPDGRSGCHASMNELGVAALRKALTDRSPSVKELACSGLSTLKK